MYIWPPGGPKIWLRYINDSYYFTIAVPCFEFKSNDEFHQARAKEEMKAPDELPPCKFAYHDCYDAGYGEQVFANYTDENKEEELEPEAAEVTPDLVEAPDARPAALGLKAGKALKR